MKFSAWEFWNRLMVVVGTLATIGGFAIAIVTLVSPGTLTSQLQAILDRVDERGAQIGSDTAAISSNTATIADRISELATSQDPVRQAEYRILVAGYTADVDGYWNAIIARDPKSADFGLIGIRLTALEIAQKMATLADNEFAMYAIGLWVQSGGAAMATADLMQASIEAERFYREASDLNQLWVRVCRNEWDRNSIVDNLFQTYSAYCDNKPKWRENLQRLQASLGGSQAFYDLVHRAPFSM